MVIDDSTYVHVEIPGVIRDPLKDTLGTVKKMGKRILHSTREHIREV